METLFRTARALDLPLGALLAESSAPRVRAIPKGSGDALRTDSGSVRLLHADGRPLRSELFELVLKPGTEQANDGHPPGIEEVVLCTAGRLRVGPLGDEVALGPGDAVWFAADTPTGLLLLGVQRAGSVPAWRRGRERTLRRGGRR